MTLHDSNEVWVVCDLRQPRFFSFGLNLLAKARELAGKVSGKTAALILDREVPDPSAAVCSPVADPVGDCIAHGADRVFALSHESLAVPQPDVFGRVLAGFIAERRPRLVLFSLTDFGRETAARAARLLNAGLIADCADINYGPETGFVADCPAWGGEIMAEIAFTDPLRIGLATVQPHAFAARTSAGDPGIVEAVGLDLPDSEPALRLIDSEIELAAKRKLEEADIVVADARSWLPLFIAKANQSAMRRLADELCADQPDDTSAGFGGRVQKLRQGREWSVEELARATGQSPDFIQRVEQNETTPPVSFLLGLAKAFDVDPGTFLQDQEKTIIQDARAQAFIKRTRNYSYQTFTPGAEDAHLRAFLVTIEPRQAHKPVAYKHQGEEFIYVLEGELEVDLDGKVHQLKALETIHFNSETPHKLKSLSTVPTRFIDVLYTP